MRTGLREGYCAKWVHTPGIWGGSQCSRKANGEDGLCSPHRAGDRRSQAARERWDAEWAAQREAERIRREQAAFVKAWREQHPRGTWGEVWTCPLCAKVIQATIGESRYHQFDVEHHQQIHGPDWQSYAALADAPRADREG